MIRYTIIHDTTSQERAVSITGAAIRHLLRPGEKVLTRESTPRICTERFVVWDDGRADRRYGAIVEWLGTWPEHTDNGDGRVARLLDGLIMYGGYRPWMANITSIVSETRVDGRVWGMGSLGRGASNVSLVTVRVTERLDGGALAEHDRQFYLATHAQGDDVSSDTADTLDGLWAQ
jgi:hypothetical protein